VSSATREIDRIVTWRPATVSEVIRETPSASTLVLDVEGWPGHRAGQHVDIRLTAEDGYHAQRSYSLASAPEDGVATITVERLDDGEVSPYLVDDAQAGDVVEIRGPVGGWFVWETTQGGPLWLIGGGSGVVPLMCMLRHRRQVAPDLPMRLLYSARTRAEVIYADELGDDAIVALTRELEGVPIEGLPRVQLGRIFPGLVAAEAFDSGLAFVCGSNAFVESMTQMLLAVGYSPDRIRTERFGPTG